MAEQAEPRTPVSESFDAIVGIAPAYGKPATSTYGLVKLTYSIQDGAPRLMTADPLLHDFRDENLEPRLRPGTDFWMTKQATDFVVQGSAHAPEGQSVTRMDVGVLVGKVAKHITVFGRRRIEWDGSDRPRITAPEQFEEMPLTYENAYGGIDWRVPVDEDDPRVIGAELESDHPGLYPRNPFGKGYLVVPGPPDAEVEMPNLEDPGDLLTPQRLVTNDPQRWFLQPLPWCFDWVRPLMFPRYCFFLPDVNAWYPGPEDATLPEIKRGFLTPGYRSAMHNRTIEEGVHPRFFQGASYGLLLLEVHGGEQVALTGMHPVQRTIRFSLPADPISMEIDVEGDRRPVQPRLHSIVCYPSEMKLTLVYGGSRDLPRSFIAGIHKHIPINLYVNGDGPIQYEAPQTVKEKIKEASEKTE